MSKPHGFNLGIPSQIIKQRVAIVPSKSNSDKEEARERCRTWEIQGSHTQSSNLDRVGHDWMWISEEQTAEHGG